MPELLYRCPRTQKEMSLGISVDADTFERADFEYRTIHCEHCGEDHEWTKEDVYLFVPPELDRKTREKKQREEERQP